MARRILLHLGFPKCGSTYLQRVMLQNADLLRANAICYPLVGFCGDDQGSGSHPGNAAHLGAITAPVLEAYFSGGMETVILSHEDLLPQALKQGTALSKLAPEMNVSVHPIAFLRPFSDFIYGDYSQHMKQFFDTFLASRNPYDGRDLMAFAQRRADTMKPAGSLLQWQNRFPRHPLRICSHRRIKALMTGFLGQALIDRMDWRIEETLVNRSIRTQDCDAIAAAMRDPDMSDDAIKEMFIAAFHKIGDHDGGRTRGRSAQIERKFAAQNETLLDVFGFDNRRKNKVPAP